MELVSVIITTYNRNDKFERALKSVLNQNYPNIEIIIVNDYPGDEMCIRDRICRGFSYINV